MMINFDPINFGTTVPVPKDTSKRELFGSARVLWVEFLV